MAVSRSRRVTPRRSNSEPIFLLPPFYFHPFYPCRRLLLASALPECVVAGSAPAAWRAGSPIKEYAQVSSRARFGVAQPDDRENGAAAAQRQPRTLAEKPHAGVQYVSQVDETHATAMPENGARQPALSEPLVEAALPTKCMASRRQRAHPRRANPSPPKGPMRARSSKFKFSFFI